MDENKTLYLIDGSAYIHRAFHAIRELSNSKGFPTNAVFGFSRILIKMMQERSPRFAAMLFDAKGATFRHDIFREYKANRPPMPEALAVQIPYIREVTVGFNLPAIEIPGYEADDLIGTLARLAEAEGFFVVMVTGDKDFAQLVTERTIIYDPMKEKTIDLAGLRETFGVSPCQMVDVSALCGDASDNIPGVPGVGQKTALSLIQRFGSLEALYSRIGEVTQKKLSENLVRFRDQAFLSRRLSIIDTCAPIDFDPDRFELKGPDNAKLSRIFREMEFRQLQEDFPEEQDRSGKRYHIVLEKAELDRLASDLEGAGFFAVDTETTSLDPMKAELVAISFSFQPDAAYYVPFGHAYPGVPDQLSRADVLERLRPVLENPEIRKVGQNVKYDWIVLSRAGIRLSGVCFDTMLASYLLNPSKRAHNLAQIALDFLDYRKITYDELTGKGGKKLAFPQVPVEKAAEYSCEDADVTLAAYRVLKAELERIGLLPLLEDVEMPLVPVLMEMEMRGISVDRDRLGELSKMFELQLDEIERAIYAVAGEEFNIKSCQQLGQILFQKLCLPTFKRTPKKTGYSTDTDVLLALAPQHELPALILRHRTLAKLKSTYADALFTLVHPETGRIHTSFNQTVTATGRLSSSDPNLQNIPIRTEEGREIRRAFVPRKGWRMVSADYSQIELRILAHYSEDPILLESFREREDIHVRTAAEVFQAQPDRVSPELRRQAKVINFGIIYGMSPFGLAKELGISQKMAKIYIDHYFSRYRGVKAFMDRTIADARRLKQTSTLLGRIRLLPDIDSANTQVRQFAERTAVNTPIQGTAADLIKLAMIRTAAAVHERGLRAGMLLSVHDELVFEIPPEEMETVTRLVREIMEGIWELRVPLEVNISSGDNWAEAH